MDVRDYYDQHIKQYLLLVYKRKHIFAGSAILITSLFVLACYLLPLKYESKTTVFIEKNVINRLMKGIAETPSIEERLRVITYAMTSRTLLLKVLDDLGTNLDRASIEDLVEKLQENTKITMKETMKETDLFIVSYMDRDPKFAMNYVNALVRRYIEENIAEKREETYGANRFFDEQLTFFKERLDKADDKVIQLRKEKGIFVVMDDRKVVEELKNAQDELDALRIKRRELEAKKLTINRQMKEEKPYTVAIYGGRYADPQERLALLQKQLDELLLHYTQNYPDVIRVRAEMESLQEQLKRQEKGVPLSDAGTGTAEVSTVNPSYQQIRDELRKTELELSAVTAREEYLSALSERKKGYLKTMPTEKKALTDLEMERDTLKKIYEELVSRQGQAQVAKHMETQDKATTFRILDPAILPDKPVSPDRLRIILMGIAAGLAGGAGLTLFLDRVDSSVKTIDALKAFKVPVLATIPAIYKEEEMIKKRKQDIRLVKIAAGYVIVIAGIVVMEAMNLKYIDRVISGIRNIF